MSKKKPPDFFGALAEHMSGDSDGKKKLIAELESTVREVATRFVLETGSDVRRILIDDPNAMLNITVCSPADRSGRDIRVSLELTHSPGGTKERMTAEHIVGKRDLR